MAAIGEQKRIALAAILTTCEPQLIGTGMVADEAIDLSARIIERLEAQFVLLPVASDDTPVREIRVGDAASAEEANP